MNKTIFGVIATALVLPFAFAVDGVVLINQSTVMASGGFPYSITQPGSYRLTGNLTVPDANTSAIVISAVSVTLDLNGFSIIGPTICTGTPVTSCSPTGTGSGVTASFFGARRDITVVNGSVRGMGAYGINLDGVDDITVEKVRATSNGTIGIIVGPNSVIVGNIANNNGFRGIQNAQGILSDNIAAGNKDIGILANCPSSVVGNKASNNGSTSLFINGAGCAVANNAVQ